LHQQIAKWQSDRTATVAAQYRLNVLSEREKEVGAELAAGLTNKEIARKLGISPRTVEAHRARLMKKVGVSSFADIVRLFMQDANNR
jgi:FixJ family two-component response regulator